MASLATNDAAAADGTKASGAVTAWAKSASFGPSTNFRHARPAHCLSCHAIRRGRRRCPDMKPRCTASGVQKRGVHPHFH